MDKERAREIREDCKWGEARAREIDREDRENGTGPYAPKEEEET